MSSHQSTTAYQTAPRAICQLFWLAALPDSTLLSLPKT